jgi:hypothetical protein
MANLRREGSRAGSVVSLSFPDKAFRNLLCPTIFPALSRSDSARENCKLLVFTCDVVVTTSGVKVSTNGFPFIVLLEKSGDAGRMEFANLRHTGQSNSPCTKQCVSTGSTKTTSFKHNIHTRSGSTI